MVQTTPDIGLSGAVCTPGVTSSQMVRSSSENDIFDTCPRRL
ncbi:NTP-binding protein [Klebsiella pneumoniae]|nr:NTP-binding protein [Klebsiella pneumoniae]EIW8794665.1 NTP-binding protein [Klebsiella pneumoniae]MBL2515498.1 NTP-binding protein [Klebsiella pneumoniae]RXX65050.1 NTP-binding protein [Klebsiella pneumoniae]